MRRDADGKLLIAKPRPTRKMDTLTPDEQLQTIISRIARQGLNDLTAHEKDDALREILTLLK